MVGLRIGLGLGVRILQAVYLYGVKYTTPQYVLLSVQPANPNPIGRTNISRVAPILSVCGTDNNVFGDIRAQAVASMPFSSSLYERCSKSFNFTLHSARQE